MISPETRASLEKRLYPDLEERVFGRFGRQLAVALGPQARVLDAGSGPGSWVIREQRERVSLWVGIDVYRPEALELDAFVLGRLESLPFADDRFDAVLAYNVLEHLREPPQVFTELARVLRPGGCFCFKTPVAGAPLFLLARLLPTQWHKRLKSGIGVDEDDVFPTYYRANSVRRLRRALQSAGFREEWLDKVDQTYAYASHSARSYALGLLYSRLTNLPFLSFLRNQIVGIYRLARERP